MRHLLDAYIRADESRVLSTFDDMTLVDLLVERPEKAVDSLPDGIRANQRSVAETIENNVRRLIVDEMSVNPKYYERMSNLLDELIRQRREDAVTYEDYLKRVSALAARAKRGEDGGARPATINTAALRAIYDNLPEEPPLPMPEPGADPRESVALNVDQAVRQVRRNAWRGHLIRERYVKGAIHDALGCYNAHTQTIFNIVKAQHEY